MYKTKVLCRLMVQLCTIHIALICIKDRLNLIRAINHLID